jgi:hypothetical protein
VARAANWLVEFVPVAVRGTEPLGAGGAEVICGMRLWPRARAAWLSGPDRGSGSDLIAVRRDRAIDVADRQHNDFQGPVQPGSSPSRYGAYVQRAPFQCRISVVEPELREIVPTAQALRADTAATPVR